MFETRSDLQQIALSRVLGSRAVATPAFDFSDAATDQQVLRTAAVSLQVLRVVQATGFITSRAEDAVAPGANGPGSGAPL